MNRKGFQLLEAVIGVAIGAGALLVLITLVQSNSRTARLNEEHAVARGTLVEISEILMGEKLATIRQLVGTHSAGLDSLLDRRLSKVRNDARPQRRLQVAPLKGKLSLELEERVGGHADLIRVTLTTELANSKPRISRLFRDAARPVVTVAAQ